MDDRRSGAERLEDVVPALRRERPAEKRRLAEGIRSGELPDRDEKENVSSLALRRFEARAPDDGQPVRARAALRSVESFRLPGRENEKHSGRAQGESASHLEDERDLALGDRADRKSTRLNSSH